MNSLGDSLAWPFRDPGWLGKIVVQGLILIIPIIGQIALYGWMLTSLDNLRQGRQELAPAGFYLGRGWPLWLVHLVYALVIGAVFLVIFLIGGRSTGSASYGIARLWDTVANLALLFLAPAIILAVYMGGVSAGLNLSEVMGLATRNVSVSLVTALVILLAGIIAVFGIILCVVGVLFTSAWAAAVTAGAVSWFERQAGSGVQPAAPAP